MGWVCPDGVGGVVFWGVLLDGSWGDLGWSWSVKVGVDLGGLGICGGLGSGVGRLGWELWWGG